MIATKKNLKNRRDNKNLQKVPQKLLKMPYKFAQNPQKEPLFAKNKINK